MAFHIKSSTATIVVSLLLAISVAGCAGKRASSSHSRVSAATTENYSQAQIQQHVQKWAAQYEKRPNDKQTALNYAAALRLNKQSSQAVAVLRRAVIVHKTDREVASAYGKSLAANGQFKQALTVVRNANPPQSPDWRLTSAEGAILDQIGENAAARQKYNEALKMAPDEPTILSNLALSYVLSNDLPRAEGILRKAAESPKANSKVRQNLALVLGLQGKFEEAESVANNELTRDQAAANIAYLRSMLKQPNTWNAIKSQDKKRG